MVQGSMALGAPTCRSGALALGLVLGLGGCSSSSKGGLGSTHSGEPEAGIIFVHPLGDGSTGHSDPPPPGTLPPGFAKTDKGGMKLGDPLTDDGPGNTGTP